MSFNARGYLKLPSVRVSPTCEEEGSLLERCIVAFIGGAAPLLVSYAIAKLDPDQQEEPSNEE